MAAKYQEELAGLIKPEYVVGAEIGVREGFFSEYILRHTKLQLLCSIDCWEPNSENNNPKGTYRAAIERMSQFGNRSQLIKDYSVPASNRFANKHFDFIYIDALHSYEAVLEDMAAWLPKMKDGGLFAGDDYDWVGVKKAVDEFVEKHNLVLHIIGEGDIQPQWYILT